MSSCSTLRRRLIQGGLVLPVLGAAKAQGLPRVTFGVVPYLPARRLAQLYAPLVPVFSSAMGREVSLASAPSYAEHMQRMRAGEYDVVADSLLLARIAQRELGYIPVVRTQAPLEPLLVVAKEAPWQRAADLRHQALAVTDRTAALAVIGLRYLRDQGLKPDRDIRVVVTGSHVNSLHRLLAGEVAGAIVSVTTLRQIEPALSARVRVLTPLPQGLSAVIYHVAPRWQPQAAAVQRAMLAFAQTDVGQAFIEALGHQGLLPVLAGQMEQLDPLVVEFYRQQAAE